MPVFFFDFRSDFQTRLGKVTLTTALDPAATTFGAMIRALNWRTTPLDLRRRSADARADAKLSRQSLTGQETRATATFFEAGALSTPWRALAIEGTSASPGGPVSPVGPDGPVGP